MSVWCAITRAGAVAADTPLKRVELIAMDMRGTHRAGPEARNAIVCQQLAWRPSACKRIRCAQAFIMWSSRIADLKANKVRHACTVLPQAKIKATPPGLDEHARHAGWRARGAKVAGCLRISSAASLSEGCALFYCEQTAFPGDRYHGTGKPGLHGA